ncbi:MFS transporter [Bordetella genomosp. 9]|uniref:MFS transporter n=1 Tax=Bordetella genomosp. 9 TaxID=1416803 RepID=A0A261RLD7_9BORD|nr:tripartite tricarboxylate transporter substrate binding protein [Bordetella genomosp. 9]OZI25868.1 MFS transporter [Bordetella genomosp. 9]
MKLRTLLCTLPMLLCAFDNAYADNYPDKPIKIVVPWAPGGAADFLARTVASRLTTRLSVPVLVENRAGAATNIGTQAVATAPGDGYTLLMASSNNCVNVSLYDNLPFDFAKDFKPITNVGLAPNVLVVHPSVPASDVTGLIDLARHEPGRLTYGSSGNGSASHLAAEMFKQQAKLDILGIPYKGAAPAVADLMGGQVQMMFTVIPPTLGPIRGGKLKLLAVASEKRLPLFPDVPTVSESGLPGFEASIWYGLVAPASTPDAIVAKLQQNVAAILAEPEVADKLQQSGTIPVGDTSAHFAQTIAQDTAAYAKVIKVAGIRAD